MDKTLYWYKVRLVQSRENAQKFTQAQQSVLHALAKKCKQTGPNSWQADKCLSGIAAKSGLSQTSLLQHIHELRHMGYIASIDKSNEKGNLTKIEFALPDVVVVSQKERLRRRLASRKGVQNEKAKGLFKYNINTYNHTRGAGVFKKRYKKAEKPERRDFRRELDEACVDKVVRLFNQKSGCKIAPLRFVAKILLEARDKYSLSSDDLTEYVSSMLCNPLRYGNGYAYFRWLFSDEALSEYLVPDQKRASADSVAKDALRFFNGLFDLDVHATPAILKRVWCAIRDKFKTLQELKNYFRQKKKRWKIRNGRRLLLWLLSFSTINDFLRANEATYASQTANYMTTSPFLNSVAAAKGADWCWSWLNNESVRIAENGRSVKIVTKNRFVRDVLELEFRMLSLTGHDVEFCDEL